VRLDHTIFKTPLSVEVTFDKSNPWEAAADPRGLWPVQSGAMGKQNDFGVVSDGHGFEDSPDCERISGGQNSKGPYAVAIGRQANMLQWGFYCAPDRMTESGRKAFLNAIVYMKQFDGQRPLVKKASRSRDWLIQYIQIARDLDTKYKQNADSYRQWITKQFPPIVIEKCGLDADKLEAWRIRNVEYIRNNGRSFAMDMDLVTLKQSNRKPEFLDWVVERLTNAPDDALARKLAKRYLGEDVEDPVAFIKANRAWMFFSDTGGFRWFVDTNAKRAATSAGRAR